MPSNLQARQLSIQAFAPLRTWFLVTTALATIVALTERPHLALAQSPRITIPDKAASMIRRAGNTEDDAKRLEILRQLQSLPRSGAPWKKELQNLESVVDRWVNDPQLFQWFHRSIREKLDYDFGVGQSSPLYPLTHLYRARILIWTANEYGNILGYHKERRRYFDRAVAELRAATR